MMKRYTIGVDPGVHCGVAVFDRDADQIILARTVGFWMLFREVLPSYPPDQADVIVEDARLNKPTFTKGNDWGGRKREKISRNVGSVQAESRLIIEGLRLLGYNVLPIKPSGRKWDARAVERITGYTGRTSEHARDAIRFCYGVRLVHTGINT